MTLAAFMTRSFRSRDEKVVACRRPAAAGHAELLYGPAGDPAPLLIYQRHTVDRSYRALTRGVTPVAEPLRCVRRRSASWPAGTSAPAPSSAWPSTSTATRSPRCVCRPTVDRRRRVRTQPDAAGRAGAGQRARLWRRSWRELGRLAHGWPAASRRRITPPAASTRRASRSPGDLLERPHPGPLPRPRPRTARRPGRGDPRPHRRPVGHPLLAQPSGQGRGMPAGRRTGSAPTASCRTAPWRPAS